MGLFNSLLGPFAMPDWTPAPKIVPAEVESTTHRTVVADEPAVTPCAAVSVSPRSLGRDAEPEHLRLKRERLQRAEVERDLALADLMLAEAHWAKHRPVWRAEP